MSSLPIGFILFCAVIVGSAGDVNLDHYMNLHSVVIVIGGTFAVLAIATPNPVIMALLRNIKALFNRRVELKDYHQELIALSQNRNSVKSSKDPLIQYAIGLWEKGIDANTFQALISQFRDKMENEDAEAVSALHHLAKYPPALGMMGTVMGMISLFAGLGSSDKSGLGPALAVAMTATFYGLLAANALLSPLADRISVETMHAKKRCGLIYEILTLVNRREPVQMIEEELTHREAA